MKKYNIWVYVEEVDEEADHYEDIDIPEKIACFNSKESAVEFVANLKGESRNEDR